MKKSIIFAAAILSLISSATIVFSSCKNEKESYTKVGLLHSLTGTMAISEIPV